MLSKLSPQAGRILISEPFMMDPNFKRSVVLLAEHTEEGTLGYVVNQVSDLEIGDVVEDFAAASHRVFIGGPVGQDTLHFVHRCYDLLQSGHDLGNGLYWGGNFETLTILLQNNAIAEEDIRFFLGYSGWGTGQLDDEIDQNTWIVGNVSHPDILFNEDMERLWKEVVIDMGPKYAHVSNFPTDPSLN
ncbi:hypothetical protein C7T94_10075 [Pedobacter yulinensis]|uniref:YqgE/AlgH family protein n=1 Tax=Pedobacter yulinensis TaxID=2126353 RepID=A0A2T3HKL1_9SPHI|nr:YqgE/AlgH family protein [Pedobacter yulinensis]PST82966.1 hypothetical protein C7T94_10075 [Pedobacter yulinensis]